MHKIIKRLKVTATFPGGREVKGFTSSYPGGQGYDGTFHIWTESGETHLINTHLAETVTFEPTYEN